MFVYLDIIALYLLFVEPTWFVLQFNAVQSLRAVYADSFYLSIFQYNVK